MEPKTKKIVSALVILLVVAGVGIGIWIFLPPPEIPTGKLVTGGIPPGVDEDHIIRVGILGPMSADQGVGQWRGAYMAMVRANLAGGVNISGEIYYFGIIAEDTHEADPEPALEKGITAATKMITNDQPDFVIGGFRTEVVEAYLPDIMAEEMLFLGTGAAGNELCQAVNDSYSTYKYFFQVAPTNGTGLVTEMMTYSFVLRNYLMPAMTGKVIGNVAVLCEDLSWADGLWYVFMNLTGGLYPSLYDIGFTNVTGIRFPADADSTDFTGYWNTLEAAQAQIVIPIVSAQGAIPMMTTYATLQPHCLLSGIDVLSQQNEFWTTTDGACEYEIGMTTLIRCDKTTLSKEFYDDFYLKYEEDPIYTAPGTYDALNLLAYAIDAGQTLNSTELIPILEAITWGNVREGVSAYLGFTSTHSPIYGTWGGQAYAFGLHCQWQEDGTKKILTTFNAIYPDSLVTGSLQLPPWGINNYTLDA